MDKDSTNNRKFRCGIVASDGACLFWCILLLFKQYILRMLNEDLSTDAFSALFDCALLNQYLTDAITDGQFFKKKEMKEIIEKMLKQVTNYIRENEELSGLAKNSADRIHSAEHYCELITKRKLLAGAVELRVLSDLLDTLICIIFIRETNGKRTIITSSYGEDNRAAEQCVFILYEENKIHYSPLYMVNTENSDEKKTIFERNDTTMVELLKEFLKEKFNYEGIINLDTSPKGDVEELICAINKFDNILPLPRNDFMIPIKISDTYYGTLLEMDIVLSHTNVFLDSNKRTKVGIDNSTACYECNDDSTTIQDEIQSEPLVHKSNENQKDLTNLSIVSNQQDQKDTSEMDIQSSGQYDTNTKVHDTSESCDELTKTK
ncbi:hypothetical protein I4U23_013918 [Adineta vaga]|nr:hypothetical protein I4U23_013918 [Adineta vaga]